VSASAKKQSIEQLLQLSTAIEKEIEVLKAEISPLQQRLESARERLDLINRLVRLTEGANSKANRSAATPAAPNDKANTNSPAKHGLEAHLESILNEAGKPVHISEIRQILVDRAVPLPGRGDEANIILRLRRAPERFTRTGRGTYALASLGLPQVPPSKRRRIVRVRKKS
jgi:hypothetical protein